MRLLLGFSLVAIVLCLYAFSIVPTYRMAKLKYNGGGDWYADRTALPNLIAFCNSNLKTNFYPEESIVEVGSKELFNYPFVYMTGHGSVIFSDRK